MSTHLKLENKRYQVKKKQLQAIYIYDTFIIFLETITELNVVGKTTRTSDTLGTTLFKEIGNHWLCTLHT